MSTGLADRIVAALGDRWNSQEKEILIDAVVEERLQSKGITQAQLWQTGYLTERKQHDDGLNRLNVEAITEDIGKPTVSTGVVR